ncbi:hypothetical protein DBT_0965 [Dissulfuribacter thermophilus]|uniref:Uncharacterized protein n=1 Tax=Dissulfuribacter thermophilus TaxID=1156395 RepID=A0A1B9F6Z4_9BACT|nr:hypothetical protein DBT_0965 [Dissulfuribacter thermophilus]
MVKEFILTAFLRLGPDNIGFKVEIGPLKIINESRQYKMTNFKMKTFYGI